MDRNKSFNQEKIQIVNRSLVLDLIRQKGICSRVTLARLSGLKQTTITNIISELITCELVVETGLMSGNKGRRSIGLKLNDDKYKVIGVCMTRSFFNVGLFGLSGQICCKKRFDVSFHEDVEVTISRIRSAILLMMKENSMCSILAVAMAMPGPYREDMDRLLFVTEFEGWQNYPIKQALAKDLNVPLYIVNDADASAFSQYWFRNKKHLIYILAGQGIGCGMVIDGKLACGSKGLAGEFGHTSINFNGPKCGCGNYGCIEKYCSWLVLCHNIKKRLTAGEESCLEADKLNVETISKAVRHGDAVACEEYTKVCTFFSVGIVNLINQINPDTIVIGDDLAMIEPDMLLSIVNEKVRECINPLLQDELTIEINPLSESPSLLGAGAIAAQHIIDDPSFIMNQYK